MAFPTAPRAPTVPPPPARGARTVRVVLDWARAALAGADGDAAREAEWLLQSRVGADPRLAADRPLTEREWALFRSDVARRARGEPLAYVLGTAAFRGLTLEVGPGVLIPRPETEGLVDLVLEALDGRRAPRALDVGTGSGAIALAIAAEMTARPDADVVATENSPAALAYARRNAARLGLRVRFVEADLWPDDAAPFDAIVANPPYVPAGADLPPSVRDWEPAEALFAGADGLAVWRRILDGATARLAEGGVLVGEIHEEAGAAIRALAAETGWAADVRRDLFGRDRYLVARRT